MGKVEVVYVRTEDQHADLVTKPLTTQKFYKNATIVLNVVRCGSNTVSAANFVCGNEWFL